MPAIIPRPKPTASRKPARRAVRAKKPFRFELTAEDIAFDQAVSAAAARGLAPHVMTMKPPISPGEILLAEYLEPMGISQNAMARAIGVPPRAVNEIVLGKRAITPAMSIRFGAFFGQSATFWHGVQVECDFRALAGRTRRLTAKIVPARELLSA